MEPEAEATMAHSYCDIATGHDAHHPRPTADWVKLFKRTFRFTGGEIVGEFLMSTGYLPVAHAEGCPVYARVAGQRPAWMRGADSRR